MKTIYNDAEFLQLLQNYHDRLNFELDRTIIGPVIKQYREKTAFSMLPPIYIRETTIPSASTYENSGTIPMVKSYPYAYASIRYLDGYDENVYVCTSSFAVQLLPLADRSRRIEVTYALKKAFLSEAAQQILARY